MKGILITGGERPDFEIIKHLLRSSPDEGIYIAAADSGLDYCIENGIRPDYILGDMDSLKNKELLNQYPESMIEEHPSEKDHSDTELGLLHLQKKGCTETIIIGGGGGRLDHLLAIVALFDRENPPELWISKNEEVRHIKNVYTGKGVEGDLISFFPCGKQRCRMITSGLKWPLDTLEWKKGDIGISNRLADNEFSIKMTSGSLIMIRPLCQGD